MPSWNVYRKRTGTLTTHDLPVVGYAPNADFWIKIIRERLDRYRTELTDAAVLNALGPVDGLRVLDAGCGEGYMSRMLSKLGAKVTGIDLNEELIDAATSLERSEPAGITYLHGSITEPIDVEPGFDVCVCNHVLNDIKDIDEAFSQIRRVLKPGGRLVALFLHPCLYSQRSGLDENDPNWPDKYFDIRTRLQGFSVAGIESPSPVRAWYLPLEGYIQALTTTGFVIMNLTEPHPTTDQLNDSWWQQNWKRPMFLLITGQLVP